MSSIDFRLRRRSGSRPGGRTPALATIDAESGLSTVDRNSTRTAPGGTGAHRGGTLDVQGDGLNFSLSRQVLQFETQSLRKRLEVAAPRTTDQVAARQVAADADKAAASANHPLVRRQAEQNGLLARRLEQIHADADASPAQQRPDAARGCPTATPARRTRVAREFSPDAVSQMRTRFGEFPDVAQIEADIAAEQKFIQAARDQLDFVETLTWLSDASEDAAETLASDEALGTQDRQVSKKTLTSLFAVRQQQLVAPLRVALNERIDVLSQLVALQQSLVTRSSGTGQALDRTIWVRDPTATTAANFRVAGQQFKELFASQAWGGGKVLATRDNHLGAVVLGVAPVVAWLCSLRSSGGEHGSRASASPTMRPIRWARRPS